MDAPMAAPESTPTPTVSIPSRAMQTVIPLAHALQAVAAAMSTSTVSPAPLTPAIRSPRSASPAPGGRSGTPSLSSLRGGGPHVDRHQSVPDDVVELMVVAQALLVEAMLHQSRAFAFLLLGKNPHQ